MGTGPPDSKTLGKEVNGLRSIPPGFSRGLRLAGDPVEEEGLVAIEDEETGFLDEAGAVVYQYPLFLSLCVAHFRRVLQSKALWMKISKLHWIESMEWTTYSPPL